MSLPHRTVAVSLLQIVLGRAENLGLGTGRVLLEAGITPEAIEDLDGRIALSSFDAAIEAIDALLGEPHFGLHVGAEGAVENLGCIHYLVRNSDTFGQCLERLTNYSRLIGDGVALTIERDGEHVWARPSIVQGESRSPAVVRYHATAWLSALVRLGRDLVGEPFRVTRVLLPPQCRREDPVYRDFFGVQPELAQDAPAIRFPSRFLTVPIANADPQLSRVMSDHASRLIDELPRVDDLRDAVGRAIERELADATMTLDRVAHRLGMSPRSLQRRLRDEGLSFREVVDDVRRGRAREYLKDRTMSVDETAFLLGFSNASAFGRACRRWTRLSPREYRSHLLSEAHG